MRQTELSLQHSLDILKPLTNISALKGRMLNLLFGSSNISGTLIEDVHSAVDRRTQGDDRINFKYKGDRLIESEGECHAAWDSYTCGL